MRVEEKNVAASRVVPNHTSLHQQSAIAEVKLNRRNRVKTPILQTNSFLSLLLIFYRTLSFSSK